MFLQLFKGSITKTLHSSCGSRLFVTVARPLNNHKNILGRIHWNPPSSIIIFRTLKKTTADEPFAHGSALKLMKLQIQDKVPRKYEMIYRVDFGYYIIGTQLMIAFTLIVTAMAAFNQAMIYITGVEPEPREPSRSLFESVVWDRFIDIGRKKLGDNWDMKVTPDMRQDVKEGGAVSASLLGLVALGFIGVLVFFLRTVPARIYTTKSGHCIAIHYRALIPGSVYQRELVAGTMKQEEKPIWGHAWYRDATGRRMIFFHRFFRTPMDFNRLIEPDKDDFDLS